MRNEQIEKAFSVWHPLWTDIVIKKSTLREDSDILLFAKAAYQAGADEQRRRVEAALKFSREET